MLLDRVVANDPTMELSSKLPAKTVSYGIGRFDGKDMVLLLSNSAYARISQWGDRGVSYSQLVLVLSA